MKIDVDTLSLRELDALLAAAEKRKAVLSTRRPLAVVRNALIAFAVSHGYAIEELVDVAPAAAAGKPTSRRKRAKVAAKYRDPENRRNTWSGRGRMPRWPAERTKRGQRAADFLVPGLARPTAKKHSAIGQRTLFIQASLIGSRVRKSAVTAASDSDSAPCGAARPLPGRSGRVVSEP